MPIARSPFPSLGECYQLLTAAFDTKASDPTRRKQLARLADSDHDWSLFPAIKRDLLIEPLAQLDCEFAQYVEAFIDYLQAHYLDLIKNVELDSLSREQALPVLVEHYAGLVGGFLQQLQQRFGGPNLGQLLDPDQTTFGQVLQWYQQHSGDSLQQLAQRLYPESKDARDQLARWHNGTRLADLSSLKVLLKTLEQAASPPLLVRNLGRWLVIGRALGYLDQQLLGAGRGAFRQPVLQALLLMPTPDSGRQALRRLNLAAGQRLNILKPGARWLSEHLDPNRDKDRTCQARTRQMLDDFITLQTRYDEDHRTGYLSAWYEGRWQLLSGNSPAALRHYAKALDAALYRAGPLQLGLLEEALSLAAALEDKILLKRMKHQAVVLGLFSTLGMEQGPVISDWEIIQLKQVFARLFPPQGLFPQAERQELQVERPFLAFDPAEIARIKVNLKHPDRVITVHALDGQKRRYPQLLWFASEGQADAVSALLQAGADVNPGDEAAGSALLCALQYAHDRNQRGALDLLLARPHAVATLDRRTHRKQLTPLIQAIDMGDAELAARLLQMGASADARGLYPLLTPLYHCLGKLCQVQRPDKTLELVLERIGQQDPVSREVLRRTLGSSAGTFGQRMPIPPGHPLYQQVLEILLELQSERCDPGQLMHIAHLLLHHGADPNAVHDYPCAGRTPLMLAAEDDQLELFKAMLAAGGEPQRQDREGADCWQIALAHGAHRVLAWLRSMPS